MNYWKDWDNRVLDSLSHSDYKEYCKAREMSFENLLLTEQYEMGISLFREACLLCIIKIAHEQVDQSLQLNMFNIRHMIEQDESGTFVNSFRQTVKKSSILDKNQTSWAQVISNRLSNKDVYVDLDIELIGYLKDTYLDKMKRLMEGLNSQLTNIASYSIGIQSTHS